MAQSKAAQFASVKGFETATEVDETGRALINSNGELAIWPQRRPLTSVTSITLTKGSFSTQLVLTNASGVPLYQIPYPSTSLVFPNSYFYLTGTYLAGGSSQLLTLRGANVFAKMTYTAGYDVAPDDLKYALLLYFRDTYSKKFNPAGLQSFSQGSYSESYNTDKLGKSRLIQEAEDILQNGGYVRVGLF